MQASPVIKCPACHVTRLCFVQPAETLASIAIPQGSLPRPDWLMMIYVYIQLYLQELQPHFELLRAIVTKVRKYFQKNMGNGIARIACQKSASVICHDVTVGQIWPQQNNTSICSGQYQKKGSETAVPSGLNPCKKTYKTTCTISSARGGPRLKFQS